MKPAPLADSEAIPRGGRNGGSSPLSAISTKSTILLEESARSRDESLNLLAGLQPAS